MSGIRSRLERLEQNAVAWDCPRCSGVFVVRVNGQLDKATKNGVPIRAEEVEEGRCPDCEREPILIRVPGLGSVPATDSATGGER